MNIGACPATQPVSDAGASLTVDDGGAPLSVDDNGGSLTVDGEVTANQGTAAAVASGWPVKVTDGADTVGISTVGADKAIKVDVIQAVASSAHTDKAAFTEGTGKHEVIGGVYNEAAAGDPAEDQAAAARITAKRALHVNIRSNAGTEMGSAGSPLRIDPTGDTTQTVDGTVAATQSGAWTADITKFGGANVVAAAAGIPKIGLTDEAGADYAHGNPLPASLVPHSESAQWRAANAYTAGQTAVAINTPSGGKKLAVLGVIITTTGSGSLKVFDHTDAGGNMLYQGTPPAGGMISIQFPTPWISSTANNVLRYTTGASAVGDITAYGYEV